MTFQCFFDMDSFDLILGFTLDLNKNYMDLY